MQRSQLNPSSPSYLGPGAALHPFPNIPSVFSVLSQVSARRNGALSSFGLLVEVLMLHVTVLVPLDPAGSQVIFSSRLDVFWTLTVDAWDTSHFRTCAVVGNSRQLKESSHGLQTDTHDWVLRWVT